MPPSRRHLLKLGFAQAILLQAGCKGALEPLDTGEELDERGDDTGALEECVASSPKSPGPFYVLPSPEVSDLREDYAGSPLRLRITLIDAATCLPLADIPIDLWHADASGLYSDVDNSAVVPGLPETYGEDWFRGRQITDADGVIEFLTHYPGWYPSVPPHLHFTSAFGETQAHIWQFYLADAFSDRVYTEVADYAEKGVHTTRVANTNVPQDLIIVPSGEPDDALIDVVVAVDLESLTLPPKPFGN